MRRLEDEVSELSKKLRDISIRADSLLRTVEKGIVDQPKARDAVFKAEAMLAERRKRDRVFDGLELFGEPAWDMLLDLFVAQARVQRVSITSASIASAVAPTTALRYLRRLQEQGLLDEYADPFDKRRRYVRLSDTGLDLINRALD